MPLWTTPPKPCLMSVFSRARAGPTSLAQGGEARDGNSDGPTAIGTHDGGALGATAPTTSTPRGATTTTIFRIHADSFEMDDVVIEEQFWRLFRQNLDTIIKAA